MTSRRRFLGTVLAAGLAHPLLRRSAYGEEQMTTIKPLPHHRALRNPLKGFTTLSTRLGHEWATLGHQYLKWNEIENAEADGVDKIRAVCDEKWQGFASRNFKVIPRVYLDWAGGNTKYWPADMETDDYTSAQFQRRVAGLVEKLGEAWDNDPRIAFIELGIFGKWGEHHSPSPTKEMQQLVGEAFSKAFRSKLVSVRHAWSEFPGFGFGEYWDSWAHYQQMWAHGEPIRELNQRTGLWRTNYIGGETAYNWGLSKVQPGEDATDSVSDPEHRDFVINSIRWLHCTQFRWIDSYDAANAKAREGAELIQRALGYRFEIDSVRFTPRIDRGTKLNVELTVRNTGSAPFYYPWPVEVSLLDMNTKQPVWKATFPDADIRAWLPGDGWTDPEWVAIDQWPGKAPKLHWSDTPQSWATPPRPCTVRSDFDVEVSAGRYLLAIAILDPAGMLPCVRFATANYINGGRHPVGVVAVSCDGGGELPAEITFDDPGADMSLAYLEAAAL